MTPVSATPYDEVFRKLNQLTPVKPEVTKTISTEGNEGIITLTFRNTSKAISFFTEVVLEKKTSGDPVLPQFLSDNYVSLFPGETKKIFVRYHLKDLKGDQLLIKIQGINLPGKVEL